MPVCLATSSAMVSSSMDGRVKGRKGAVPVEVDAEGSGSSREAAVGRALVSAIGLEIARSFLHFYISRTLSLSLVYGSLGLVPVFMFWMYVIWMIVLVGLQVAVLWDALARRGLQNLMDRHPTNASA